jgi:hypothetical protein
MPDFLPVLPLELWEIILIKAGVALHKVFRVRLLPSADLLTLVTLITVCYQWWQMLDRREFIRKQLRNLFQTVRFYIRFDCPPINYMNS